MNVLLFVADRKYTQAVIDYARLMVERTGGRVSIQYVCTRPRLLKLGEQALTGASEALADIMDQAFMDEGDPIEILEKRLAEKDYDLVMVGARQSLTYWQRRLASLSKKVIDDLPHSVLVVRQPHARLERILICTGGLPSAEKMISAGASLAGQLGAHATLLYVGGSVPSMYTGLDQMDESLEELLDRDTPLAKHLRRSAQILAEHNVDAHVELRHGVVSENILDEILNGHYDLVVMGASGANANVQGFLMGNVTRQVFEQSACPVWVVKTE